ncbi:hypothetical protein BO70DRAFT_374849 [Aspergillus heteromorphus CBS 117.55]|uniref:Mid2 domain-containing protein n=1 Tax=Aspergillus heteromorphus CBS 117.55 TaxID=1448321 RepID=A0A317UVF5_9EURO|nr:uncharacterized protein BO70DRAFT_374849 [Aspergillus heteromorphus CBS 117.55]PWY66004.1 hypothetical protein BO70DRAFT_374849 [Aspergillus heteromorphus CBS 117.55]
MLLRCLLALGALSSVTLAHPEPAADLSLPPLPPNTAVAAFPTPALGDMSQKPKRYHHEWILQKRATTTADTATTTSDDTTTTSTTEATSTTESTTAAATTTTSESTTSTTSTTSATSASTSSTSTATATTSTSSATTTSASTSTTSSTTTTSTASTTSSTSTATSTVSAKQRARDRRGEIAAIIVFGSLIIVFVALTCFLCMRENRKARRIAAHKAALDAGSDYSMVPLAENGATPRPQSVATKFDRASMMFATHSVDSVVYSGQDNARPMTRPTSMAASETLSRGPAPGTPTAEQQMHHV